MYLFNGKLPKGSFYYVQLGKMYYAGEKPVFTTSVNRNVTWDDFRAVRTFKANNRITRAYMHNLVFPEIKRELIGHRSFLTNNFTSSKQFRKLKQAKTIYNALAQMYVGIATPKIGIHYG
jgi:hypothetical protein